MSQGQVAIDYGAIIPLFQSPHPTRQQTPDESLRRSTAPMDDSAEMRMISRKMSPGTARWWRNGLKKCAVPRALTRAKMTMPRVPANFPGGRDHAARAALTSPRGGTSGRGVDDTFEPTCSAPSARLADRHHFGRLSVPTGCESRGADSRVEAPPTVRKRRLRFDDMTSP
jgi:hypothetical protein